MIDRMFNRFLRSSTSAALRTALLLSSGLAATSLFAQTPPAPLPPVVDPRAAQQPPTTPTTPAPAKAPAAAARQSSVVEYDGRAGTAQNGSPAARRPAGRTLARSALRSIELFHGEARLVPVAGTIRRIAIGNGGILSATSVDEGVLVLGEHAGSSSVMIWTDQRLEEYLFSVTETDTSKTSKYLEALMRDFPTVTAERIGDRVVLRGAVYKNQLEQINGIVTSMPNVVNLLREDEGFPKRKTVHFKVQIVELSRTVAQDLGIAWDKTFAGPRLDFQRTGRATGIYNPLPAPQNGDQLFTPNRFPAQIGNAMGGTYFGIATNILSSINVALNNGDATVLAAPEVSTASGGEAKFLAGGQVPIVTSSFGGTSIEYKDYGIILNLKPLVDRDDNISASIETEVSQLDPSTTFNGYPAFLTRKSRSDVSLRPLETLVISGLVNSSWSRSADKVPGIADVPILGRLFRSDNFRNQRSDLVIFVTPDVTSTQDPVQPLVDKAREIGDRVPPVQIDPLFSPPPSFSDTKMVTPPPGTVPSPAPRVGPDGAVLMTPPVVDPGTTR